MLKLFLIFFFAISFLKVHAFTHWHHSIVPFADKKKDCSSFHNATKNHREIVRLAQTMKKMQDNYDHAIVKNDSVIKSTFPIVKRMIEDMGESEFIQLPVSRRSFNNIRAFLQNKTFPNNNDHVLDMLVSGEKLEVKREAMLLIADEVRERRLKHEILTNYRRSLREIPKEHKAGSEELLLQFSSIVGRPYITPFRLLFEKRKISDISGIEDFSSDSDLNRYCFGIDLSNNHFDEVNVHDLECIKKTFPKIHQINFNNNLITQLNWDLIEYSNKEHISVSFCGNRIEKIVGTPSMDLKKPSFRHIIVDLRSNKLSNSEIKKIKTATDVKFGYKVLIACASIVKQVDCLQTRFQRTLCILSTISRLNFIRSAIRFEMGMDNQSVRSDLELPYSFLIPIFAVLSFECIPSIRKFYQQVLDKNKTVMIKL